MSNDTFNTTQVRAGDKPQSKTSMDITTPMHSTDVPIGLNCIDAANTAYLRIRTSVDSPPKSAGASAKAIVHLDAWDDTVLYSAGCTWLDVCKHDRDFQFGTCSTGKLDASKQKTSIQVKFDKPYAEVPKIVVWFKELDVANDAHCRVKACASEITATGFTCSIETWEDTTLHKATATWIAHPSTRSNITSGHFNTKDIRPVNKPQLQNGTDIKFDKKFERAPRVLVALNYLDMSKAAHLRVKVSKENVTAEGMKLNIDSWLDSIMFAAGVSYLAIQEY